ncbi:MAG: hypothetical protein RLZZ458_1331, partial [Planctomycetota bacterium]
QQRALALAELRLTLAEPDTDVGALQAIAATAAQLGLSDAARDFQRLAKEVADSALKNSNSETQQTEPLGLGRTPQQ